MSRAAAVLAVIAFVATGCATQGTSTQFRSDLSQIRSQLADTRAAHESVARDVARATAELQALDARTRELADGVRTNAADITRLSARLDLAEEALRATRARVEALATPPPAPPPAATPPAASPPAPSAAPPPAPRPASPPAPPSVARPAPRLPSPAAAPVERPVRGTREPAAAGAEQSYAAALATFRAREHGQAVLDLLDFLARYPRHPLAGNAQFWIGEAYYVQHDYRQALVEFRKVLEIGLGKMPEALVRIGLCHLNLRDPNRARQTWQRVVRDYPQSDSASVARTLLRTHAARR